LRLAPESTGPLPASANKSKPKEASDIREALHPQT
jgi:hypothetical protein